MKSLIFLFLASFCLVKSQYSWNGTTWNWKEGEGQNKPTIVFSSDDYYEDEYEKEGSGDQVDDTEIEYNYEDSEVQPKEQVTSTTTASTSETQKDATTSTTPENFSSDST